MSAHITSFVILCRPQMRHSACAAISALPGVEVYHCGEDGKIVAVAEGGDEFHIGDAFTKMQSAPGVVAANMVYHGIDEDEDETEGPDGQ